MRAYLYVVFFILSGWLAAQCPSIANNNPQFCDLDQAQVSDLPAVDNGAGVNWFRTPSSNTPIPSNEFLTDNQVLFLDSASGGCGNRQRVTVGIFGQPRGANFQGICVTDNMQPTLDDLAVNGIDILWYDQNTGGSSLPLSTPIFDGQIYYADQRNPVTNCRTSRLSVVVEIVFVNSPTGDPIQTFCSATSSPTVADLVASGENRWYRNANSAAPLDLTTPLEDGEDYFATTIDLPCESSNRFRVEVVLEPANDSGDDTTVDLCSSNLVGQPTLDLFSLLNGTPSAGGAWSGPVPISGSSVNTSDLNINGGPYIFTYSVTASATCPASSSTLTINITEPLSAGIGDTINLCESSAPIDLFSILGGNPDPGGTWTPALNSGTDIFNPAVDVAGSYTYSFPATPPCNQASFATIIVNLENEANAGVGGSADICESDGLIDLFTFLGGNPDIGGFWTPSLVSGTGIFDPLTDPAGDYIYTVSATPPCTQTDQAVLSVTIDNVPDAGEDGDVQLCETDAPVDLFTFLGGTPDAGGVWTPALASGTGILDPSVDTTGTYTYTVTSSGSCTTSAQSEVLVIVQNLPNTGNDNSVDVCENGATIDLFTLLGPDAEAGGGWTPTLSSGTGFYDPAIDPAGTYTYSITATGFCSDIVSSSVTVNLLDAPNAGLDSAIDFCSTDAPRDLFAEIAGNPDPGGIWIPALASGSGVFDPQIDTAGGYQYQVSGNTSCGTSDTSLITVTIQQAANAGIGGNADICENDGPVDLLSLLGGNPDNGGFWTPSLASGSNIFDPLVDPTGNYTYTVSATPPCTQTDQAVLSVTIDTVPDAGEDGDVQLCETDAPVDLFTFLGGTPDAGGAWTPALASGTGILDPSVDTTGTYTYTVSSSGSCTTSAQSEVLVIVQNLPNTGNDNSVDVCENGAPIDLFTLLGPDAEAGGVWTPTLSSGTGFYDPAIDPAGTYTYSITATGFCSDIVSSSVTVNLLDAPNAGLDSAIDFCSTDAPRDLFAEIAGNPDPGGIWIPTLASGSGVFDPQVDTAGGYQYQVSGNTSCGTSDTSLITVTVQQAANAGIGGNADICENDGPVDLFTLLGGNPDAGGFWTPSLASGTGIFDPLVDAGGSYVYNVNPTVPCTTASTATLVITIREAPDAGTDASIDLCESSAIVDLFTVLGGTPDSGGVWSPSLSSGTGIFDPSVDSAGIYEYTVTDSGCTNSSSSFVTVNLQTEPDAGVDASIAICAFDGPTNLFSVLGGTPDAGGFWTPTLSDNDNIFRPGVDASGTYTYTVNGIATCTSSATASVIVNSQPQPDSGINGISSICSGDSPVDLFSALGGSPDSGGSWFPALNSGTGIFDPAIDPAGSYSYTVVSPEPCNIAASSTVDVTIVPSSDSGEDSSIAICPNATALDLFTELGGSPDPGGTWAPVLNSGTGIFDPAIDPEGVYTYTVAGTSQCPSPSSSTVSISFEDTPSAGNDASINFCESDPRLDLFTLLGNGADTGGTWSPALNSGTGLFNPAIDPSGVYTYTVNSGIPCNLSDSAQVTVSVQNLPNAGQDRNLTLCVNDTPVNLFVILGGSPDAGGIWSPSLASGSGVFDPAVDTAGAYTYTVAATAPCTTSDTSVVTVNVEDAPDAGTDASVDLCSNDNPIDLFTILGGTPDAGGTWSPALASGSGVFDPSVDAAGVYTYTVTSAACATSSTSQVTVNITPEADAGQDATLDICSNDAAIDLFTLLGGTPDVGGTWSPALASGSGVFDPAVDTAGTYTYTVGATAPCTTDDSAVVTVTVEDAPDAGTDASLDLCSNDNPIDLFTVLGGTPDAGGTWSPTLASGSGVFDPAVDAAGVYTYMVTSAACATSSTSQVTVNITPEADAGQDATLDICSNDAAIDLFTLLGGTPDAGGTWSPALASGSGVFDPAVDTAGAYTYTVAATAPCTTDDSAVVTVTVEDAPDAGTDASLDLCSNDNPIDLFTVLGGTPDAGGTWSPTLASGSGVFDPAVDAAGIYTYTITSAACATSSTSEVTVNVTPEANAGQDATLDTCSNDAAIDLFTLLGGTPDAGGTWSPALASGSGVFDPAVDTAGAYTYTVAATAPCTTDDSAVVTVNVEDAPDAGTDASVDLCSNNNPIDLFTVLGGTPDAGGTWSPALPSGSGVFDPAVDAAGVYTYTLSANFCGAASSSSVTVVLDNPIELNNVVITPEPEVCLGNGNNVLIQGLSNLPDGFYDFEFQLSGANSANLTFNLEVLAGTTQADILASSLINSGLTNIELLSISSNMLPCGIVITNIPLEVFEVISTAPVTLEPNGNIFCEEDNPTIQDLTNNLNTTLSVNWFDSAIGGNLFDPQDALTNGAIYYAEAISSSNCVTNQRVEVRVLVEPCDDLGIIIPDGFSPNGDGINETFEIKNLRQLYPFFVLRIYNRNGDILFTGRAQDPDWDGSNARDVTIGSGTLPAGVYFFVLDLNANKDDIQGRFYLSD